MKKTVSNARIANAVLESENILSVEFPKSYKYYSVINNSSNDIYVSTVDPECTVGGDDVMCVPPGAEYNHYNGFSVNKEIYLSGSGAVTVIAKDEVCNSFQLVPKGGDNTASGATYYSLANAADYPILGLSLYGKSTQDGTPTPTNPVDIVSVGDSGNVEITACGKNLLNPTLQTTTINGVTCTSNGDGTYTLNGTATANAGFHLIPTNELRKLAKNYIGKSLRFVGCPSSGDYTTYFLSMQGLVVDGINERDIGNGCTIENVSDFTNFENVYIYILVRSGYTIDNVVFKPMITTDLNATYDDYEPYKGSTASITTALPLCGVGDVCDELIYNADGTGKIVKRIGKYTFTGNESFALRGNRDNMYMYSVTNALQFKRGLQAFIICDKYKNVGNAENWQAALNLLNANEVCVWNKTDNCTVYFGSSCTGLEDFKAEIAGAAVVYQLAEPTEIELSAAEMAQLRELRTYSGITNITNDGSADMDVKYCTNNMLSKCVMPIISGMQKQIDELNAAVLSLGSNV